MEDQFVFEKATTDEDILAFFSLAEYAFRESPMTEEARKTNQVPRIAEFREGLLILCKDKTTSQSVCSGINFQMKQNVRGVVFEMGGIAGITSLPEVRRKGIIRKMMIYFFEEMFKSQTPVSALYPFKESFYEKLGYVTMPCPKQYIFNPKALSFLLKKEMNTKIIRKELNQETIGEFYQFLEEYQKIHHGTVLSTGSKRNRWVWGMDRHWLVFVQDSKGNKTGLLLFRMKGLFQPMKIMHFLTLNSEAKYSLLQYIALHIDQCSEVHVQFPPNSHPETWFSDFAPKIEDSHTPSHTGGMSRIIIVEKISGIHVGRGKFYANIKDQYCPWNNNTFLFESIDGILKVAKENSNEAFDLTIEGLTWLIYNGGNPGDLQFRDWGNPNETQQKILREMFPEAAPYFIEPF